MAISKVNPAAVASSINASSITATAANTLYEGTVSLDPAIYTITCASGTIARIEFYSDNVTLITNAVTASGTVTINLATAATKIRVWINTGSNIVVTVTKTAASLTGTTISGTLDTITTVGSSTYTGTSTSGYGYAVLVGGGGASGGYPGGSGGAGGGGGAGVAEKLVQLTGSMAVTIGAGGTAGGSQTTGGTGGASTFASMTANGGAGGTSANQGNGTGGAGGTATGGTHNNTGTSGTDGGGGAGGNGGSPSNVYKFVVATVGTGASNTGYNGPSQQGTGKGAGASGTSHSNDNSGGAGTAGVLYVLRF